MRGADGGKARAAAKARWDKARALRQKTTQAQRPGWARAKLAAMRAAKARKRMANPVEREPKFVPYYPLEFGLRDTRTGEVAWVEFRSVRDAARRLAVINNYYLAP